MAGVVTNLNIANNVILATGAATVTSNLASYFDLYQSMFTVGISAITCTGFVISIGWGMWIKWADHKETKRHHKEIEGSESSVE